MLPMKEYLNIARKMIKKYGYPIMLRDEDAIAYIANSIMVADTKYDNATGNIEGFRYMHARYGIMNWYNRNMKNKKRTVELTERTPSSDSVSQNVEINEILSYVDTLPEKYRQVIHSYYFDKKTLKEIGNDLNLSHQGVNLRLQKALQLIREKFND